MKYTLAMELTFKDNAKCTQCPFRACNDCGDEWCTAARKDLVKNEQDSDTCECENVKQYEGDRPTWCPLVEAME